MKIHNSFVAIGLLLITSPVFSQKLFQTTEFNKAIKNETRTASGTAGKNYWQNRGDYSIKVNFDPVSNLLSGDEVITYYNNSPDKLNEIIIRLYPDLYKKGCRKVKPN